jgi:chaperone required for assembly of F1-ATPase
MATVEENNFKPNRGERLLMKIIKDLTEKEGVMIEVDGKMVKGVPRDRIEAEWEKQYTPSAAELLAHDVEKQCEIITDALLAIAAAIAKARD